MPVDGSDKQLKIKVSATVDYARCKCDVDKAIFKSKMKFDLEALSLHLNILSLLNFISAS